MKIFISNNAANLKAELANYLFSATVEAEYRDDLVQGSVLTLAHHGPRKIQVAPCLWPDMTPVMVDVIGISHFDLDTLGGIMAVMGAKNDAIDWITAAKVDVSGIHKVETTESLDAFYAWSESNRLFAPRDGSVLDCTEFVMGAVRFARGITPEALEDGRKWKANKAELEAGSFVTLYGGISERRRIVCLRESASFVNHLYSHDGVTAAAVVGFNTKTKAITLSLADPIEGVSCRAIMQEQFGPNAGGHDGIAGTPRDKEYTLVAAQALALRVSQA